MKRMTLIAAALCLIMLTTVGAGIVAAKQQENPRQAGASSIYFLDVAATGTHGPGTLKIDVKHHTFVFNGKGFTPDKTYTLVDTTTSSGIHVFATGQATPSGNLNLKGTWAKDAAPSIVGAFPLPKIGDVVTGTLDQSVDNSDRTPFYFYKFTSPEYGTFLLDRPSGDTGGAYVGHQATATVTGFGTAIDSTIPPTKVDVVISGDGPLFHSYLRTP